MQIPHGNPLFERLWPLDPDGDPQERVAAALAAYTDATGVALRNPLSNEEQKTVRRWLLAAEDSALADENGHSVAIMSKKVPRMAPLVHPDAAHKASWLQQARCPTCLTDVSRSPLRISFSVRTRPFSAQALTASDLKALKSKIAESMQRRLIENDWLGRPLCVRIVAVVGAKDPSKDVDNLVKGLLDSLQGSIYTNDSYISHISIDRFRHEGELGFYLVSVQPVMDALADVVHREVEVGWAGQAEIVL